MRDDPSTSLLSNASVDSRLFKSVFSIFSLIFQLLHALLMARGEIRVMMMLRNLSLDFEISQDTWIEIAKLEEDQSKSFFL